MRKLKTGVCYLDVNYNVNTNKRAVACNLTFGINLNRIPFNDMLLGSVRFKEFLDNNFYIEDWLLGDNNEEGTYAVANIVGLSYCHPEDEFDAELGKKIALTRAQEGAFEQAQVFWNKAEEVMLEAANRFSVISENCDDSRIKCIEHTNELS
jgi:hypothetical protein